jgi:hypothetical protein
MKFFQQKDAEDAKVGIHMPAFPFSPSSIGVLKDHSTDAVGEFHFVEVDQQTNRNIKQFHVAEELRFS